MTPQPSVPPIARTLSDAPTVMTFFAVPGDLIVLAPAPEFPAETTSMNCWFPATPGWASRTSASNSWEKALYAPPEFAPQELFEIRAPLRRRAVQGRDRRRDVEVPDAVEDLGGADPAERLDAHSVVEALRVLDGRRRSAVL